MATYSRKVKFEVRPNPSKFTPHFLFEMEKTYPGDGLRNAKRIAETSIKYLSKAEPSKVQTYREIKDTLHFWENVLGLLNKVKSVTTA